MGTHYQAKLSLLQLWWKRTGSIQGLTGWQRGCLLVRRWQEWLPSGGQSQTSAAWRVREGPAHCSQGSTPGRMEIGASAWDSRIGVFAVCYGRLSTYSKRVRAWVQLQILDGFMSHVSWPCCHPWQCWVIQSTWGQCPRPAQSTWDSHWLCWRGLAWCRKRALLVCVGGWVYGCVCVSVCGWVQYATNMPRLLLCNVHGTLETQNLMLDDKEL